VNVKLPESRERKSWFTPRRQNAIAWIIIAIVFFIGARFMISDPGSGEIICVTIPYGPDIPVFSCPFYSITTLPCPFCGITRSVAYMVRGNLAESFHVHPLGPLFTLVMLLVIPLSIRKLLVKEPESPGQSGSESTIDAGRWMMWILLGLLIAAWFISLARHFGLIVW